MYDDYLSTTKQSAKEACLASGEGISKSLEGSA